MPTIPSANMLLPVPVVGVDPGPDYAINVNDCFFFVDSHDHSPGKGVLITPAGLDISSTLTFANNPATNLSYINFLAQVSVLPARSLYVLNNDLYYRDGNNLQIAITTAGGVAGSPGSIGNLFAPASCSYDTLTQTFIFSSAPLSAANISVADVILNNNTSPFNTVTLKAPLSLPLSYTFSYPSVLPPVQSFVTLDSTGNLAAPWTVDSTTIEISGGTTVQVKDGGITLAKLAAAVKETLVPTGTILTYGGINAPAGYLFCDGSTPLRSAYPALFAATSINFTTVSRNGTSTLTIGGGQDPQALGVRPGMGLSGTGIPNGAVVVSVTPTTIVMSNVATGIGTDTMDICFFGAGNGTTTFNLPDFRGRFLRGVDFTANRDPDKNSRSPMNSNGNTGNNLGSVQGDAFASHNHTLPQLGTVDNAAGPSPHRGGNPAGYNQSSSGFTGGSETRPLNAYVNFIIKT